MEPEQQTEDTISFNQDLAELALRIADEAGHLAMEGEKDARVMDTKSSPLDLVTQMDRATEALIRRRLDEARPDDGFLGEESGAEAPADPDGVRWIVDPIDGTVNYVYGIPNWAVSIAAEQDGRVIAGAVVAPSLRETYLAVRGGGSFRVEGDRRRRLACSTQSDLAMALIATGFGYRSERRASQGRVIAELIPEVRDIRRCGAAALDLCWVGDGRVDASYERGLNPWDRAAAGLVASEAGALVGGLRGRGPTEDMTVAASPALFTRLTARLEALDADGPET